MGHYNMTVAYQIMWNRLISVVEEQAQALVRTAFSTSVREAGDLSAGVYDIQGKMLAQAVTGTPGHVNAMAESVIHFINCIGFENIFEDDIYITNDPWMGTGHLHDITVVTPVFFEKKLVSFFACTAHIVDIGGRGFGADAQSVFEEGLYIPIMKLSEKGKINQSLLSIIKANVREPDQVVGDVHALATCNEVGKRRLWEMMSEFKLCDLNKIAKFIFDTSRKATKSKISALPKGSAYGEMTIDGYSKPINLKLKLIVQKTNIICDFSGSSEVDVNGINVPLVYTKAYTCYALKCAIAPEIPNNTASLEPFKVVAPKNSIVNATHPAPVALRHVIGHFIPDTVYNALDKIIPSFVPAEGAGTLCNFQVSLRPELETSSTKKNERAEVLTFNSGGSGARPKLDGMNATAFPSGVMTMPIEATEHTGPVIIWRKELRPDSGGDGKFRGGLGQFMEVGAKEGYVYDFQAMFDRVKHPARGRNGAHKGSPTIVKRDDGLQLKGKGKQFIPKGKRVILSFPGGGGYGSPSNRKLSSIKRDLALGYISKKTARTVYGLSTNEIDKIFYAIKKGLFNG
ncbi:MAG: hydantoinase B/oxoprolinase family protein [Pseudomonadota bacterium]|nr:hydantoinase B/oxoprolinase family protein [Pseudomonadota bacterium]